MNHSFLLIRSGMKCLVRAPCSSHPWEGLRQADQKIIERMLTRVDIRRAVERCSNGPLSSVTRRRGQIRSCFFFECVRRIKTVGAYPTLPLHWRSFCLRRSKGGGGGTEGPDGRRNENGTPTVDANRVNAPPESRLNVPSYLSTSPRFLFFLAFG